MPNGIIVIDKPQEWTASEFALMERGPAYARPLIRTGDSSFSRHNLLRSLRRENWRFCYA